MKRHQQRIRTSFGYMTFAWKEEPLAFWQLLQWQSTLVNGCPVTEYFTALQRQEPYRLLEEMLAEACKAEEAMLDRVCK
jgi:hypothetical protein